ncbi:hypothetical protein H9L39_00320 [Fusarium oxysporum f. sp. albedinis]|nr:hypothetical protein H9L39_00320 [Fusarium oxysporum f. sp. albedinis]
MCKDADLTASAHNPFFCIFDIKLGGKLFLSSIRNDFSPHDGALSGTWFLLRHVITSHLDLAGLPTKSPAADVPIDE